MVRNIEADEKRLEEIRAWQEEALATGALVPRREAFLLAQLDAALARAEKAERERDAFVFFAGEIMTPHIRGSE